MCSDHRTPPSAAAALAAIGPSPRWLHRRHLVRRAAWDVFQALCVFACSLYLFAKRPSSLADVWRAAAAEPFEASCACFANLFMISGCGNSPLAWAAALAFASVEEDQFARYLDGVFRVWGEPFDGGLSCWVLGITAWSFFTVPYLVQGLLLLPLELWASATRAAREYKLQPKKHVATPRRVAYVMGVSLSHLVFIGIPYVMSIVAVSFFSRGARGVRFGPGALPPHSERAWMLVAHLLTNELLFFYAHWALHKVGSLYQTIHKVHHEFTAPFALAAVYCHPVEFVAADLIPFTAGFLVFRPHIFFVYMWITLACLGTQTHHSGYRMPWIAGPDQNPDFHDFHHMRFHCCYGNIGWLDALHGTSRPFYEAKAAQRAARDKAQAAWEEEVDAIRAQHGLMEANGKPKRA